MEGGEREVWKEVKGKCGGVLREEREGKRGVVGRNDAWEFKGRGGSRNNIIKGGGDRRGEKEDLKEGSRRFRKLNIAMGCPCKGAIVHSPDTHTVKHRC